MSTDTRVRGLVADLVAEREELCALLAEQDDAFWTRPTPAEGWTTHDEIAHLAFFDDVTRTAVSDAEAFGMFIDRMGDLQTYVDGVGPRHARLSPDEMVEWWTRAGESLAVAALEADPSVRVPWFGPSMSLASKLTARIMETWAHGQDIYDTAGVPREPSARLQHVARIGVLAFPNSFRSRGLATPHAVVHIDLEAPDGSRWTWGDPGSVDTVRGTAEDFCLVVTQRRHRADTGLEAHGPVAKQWMDVAQAFAGPPGAGRAAGQFSRDEHEATP